VARFLPLEIAFRDTKIELLDDLTFTPQPPDDSYFNPHDG
jgi:hypothetical protein